MSSDSNKSFCILPWINTLVDEEGQFRVCCYSNRDKGSFISKTSIGDIKNINDIQNSEYMKDIRCKMMNGEKLSMCEYCYKVEEKSLSHRQIMNKKYDELVNEYVPLTLSDGTIQNPYKTIEIRMGNQCNLKCRMCSPQWSSSLAKEYKEIHGKSFVYKSGGNLKWYEIDTNIEMLKNFLPSCKYIYFGGSGEPFLNNQIPNILEWLVENDYAKNQVIIYSTNATLIPHKHIKFWKYFESISLTCSVDSFENVYEYIRYPSSWNNILSNLHYFDDLSDDINFSRFELNATLQTLNLFNFDEFISWLYHSDFKRLSKIPRIKPLMFPKHMDARYLPHNIKEECYSKIEKVVNSFSILNDILKQIDYIFTENSDLKVIKKLFSEMKVIDDHRGIEIENYIPIKDLKNLVCKSKL